MNPAAVSATTAILADTAAVPASVDESYLENEPVATPSPWMKDRGLSPR